MASTRAVKVSRGMKRAGSMAMKKCPRSGSYSRRERRSSRCCQGKLAPLRTPARASMIMERPVPLYPTAGAPIGRPQERLPEVLRAGGGPPLLVQHPPLRQGLPLGHGQPDLAHRGHAHGDVQQQGRVGPRGDAYSQRVVAQGGGGAPVGGQAGPPVGGADPDQPLPRPQPGVVPGGAVVVGAPGGDHPHPPGAGLLDGLAHGHHTHPLPRPVVPVQRACTADSPSTRIAGVGLSRPLDTRLA